MPSSSSSPVSPTPLNTGTCAASATPVASCSSWTSHLSCCASEHGSPLPWCLQCGPRLPLWRMTASAWRATTPKRCQLTPTCRCWRRACNFWSGTSRYGNVTAQDGLRAGCQKSVARPASREVAWCDDSGKAGARTYLTYLLTLNGWALSQAFCLIRALPPPPAAKH